MEKRFAARLSEVNKELWLVFSLFIIAAVLNFAIASNRIVLGFYTLPTLFAAYNYGRRHATLTAVASSSMVVLLTLWNPAILSLSDGPQIDQKWYDIAAWAGILVVTGYAMGTLYDSKERHLSELRETYHGVLLILCHFISKDKYTQNHSYRVSVYASTIAAEMNLSDARIEDVRASALLHDIGKLDISRELLYKAARLTNDEFEEMSAHVQKGVGLLEPVGGSLRRVLPIILSHHDKFDGSGTNGARGENIPIEARIISVADVYDALTSDRPYRKAMTPFDARDAIIQGSGSEFDPHVVDAFVNAFRKNELEIPEVMI